MKEDPLKRMIHQALMSTIWTCPLCNKVGIRIGPDFSALCIKCGKLLHTDKTNIEKVLGLELWGRRS